MELGCRGFSFCKVFLKGEIYIVREVLSSIETPRLQILEVFVSI